MGACCSKTQGAETHHRRDVGLPNGKSKDNFEKDKSTSNLDGGANASNGKLLDKYSLGKVLGQGAFGVVYKCKKKHTEEEYAVKMIDIVETKLEEIKREASMLDKLEHPTVIRLHDVFYEKVFVCMVLDYYKGGDMIQGMMAHWKTKGMIPISNVKGLSKQMHAAITWIHSKDCVHRDVKGDNFMMDKPFVETKDQRLFLSDFGTVVDISPGERIKEKCGTKNYWPPEFFSLNYGKKVDCWAVGVVMFGLVSGKFPFKGEEDVKHKALTIPKRCPGNGAKLILALLERVEDKRMECAEALKHEFLLQEAVPAHAEMGTMSSDELADIKETGANAGVAQRRAELVDRLQKAEEGTGKRRGAEIGTEKTFSVATPGTERTFVFKWQKASEARGLVDGFKTAKPVPTGDLINKEVTEDSVRQMLQDHGREVTGFGKPPAKKFSEFVSEIQSGQCRLLLDATQHKFVVRAVDMVLLRISYGSGDKKRILVEKNEKKSALPGNIQLPQENGLQAAERLRNELLGIQDHHIKWDLNSSEAFEQTEDSAQYPGIQTVYRNKIMVGEVTTSDNKALQRLGLQSDKFKFEYNAGGVTRSFEWMDEKGCVSTGVTIRAKKNQDFSALVYPPIGLEEEELHEFLDKNNIDTGKWGQGTFKTLGDFSEELVKGESTLIKQVKGKVARVVDIVVLHLTRKDTGEVLVETEEKYKESVQKLNRLPAVKRRSDEHQFYTARRLISKHLGLDNNRVELQTEVLIVEEEQESTSYANLPSIYRKRYMKAVFVPDS